jgi:hypothetical protein
VTVFMQARRRRTGESTAVGVAARVEMRSGWVRSRKLREDAIERLEILAVETDNLGRRLVELPHHLGTRP